MIAHSLKRQLSLAHLQIRVQLWQLAASIQACCKDAAVPAFCILSSCGASCTNMHAAVPHVNLHLINKAGQCAHNEQQNQAGLSHTAQHVTLQLRYRLQTLERCV